MHSDLSVDYRTLRKSTGLTMKDFAKEYGIPYRTQQDWETGARKMPEYLFDLIEYKIKHEKEKTNE